MGFLTNWKALATWLFSDARFERQCGMPCVTFLVAKLCQFFDCSSDVFDMLVNMAFG